MSALSSGYEGAENFYNVKQPLPGDLGEPYVGACYSQRINTQWMPNVMSTIWVVTKVKDDKVTIQPCAGGSNRARHQRNNRILPISILKTEYTFCDQQRQYPPR